MDFNISTCRAFWAPSKPRSDLACWPSLLAFTLRGSWAIVSGAAPPPAGDFSVPSRWGPRPRVTAPLSSRSRKRLQRAGGGKGDVK
eukprot:1719760-Pyramimonas_sp.AAC.1